MAEGIAMLNVGRSGSRVLGDMLNRHPDVSWSHEPFMRNRWRKLAGPPGPNRIDPVDYIARKLRSADTRAFGFVAKPWQVLELGYALGDFLDGLRGVGVRGFIVLERRNLLRKVVSTMRARMHGVWHRRVGHDAPSAPVRIDVEAVEIDRGCQPLVATLERLADFAPRCAQLLDGEDHLRLVYEDDVRDDPGRGYHRICRYLGIEPVHVEPAFVKMNPYPLAQLVENLDDVRAAVAGTAFEWMVDG